MADETDALDSPDIDLPRALAIARAEARDRALLEAITATVELPRLLDMLGEQLEAADEVAGYVVLLSDPSGDKVSIEKLRLPAGYEHLQQTYLHTRMPISADDITHRCISERAVVYVDASQLDQASNNTRTRFELMRLSAMMAVPLLAGERVLGAVAAYKQNGPIAPEIGQRLQRLLGFFGPALANALYLSELQRKEHELQLAEQKQQEFLRFITTVNDLTSTQEIYQAIAREFMQKFPLHLVGFALRERDELVVQRLVLGDLSFESRYQALHEFYSASRYKLDASGGGLGITYQTNAPLVFPDLQALLHLPMTPQDRQAMELMGTPRTLLTMPIRRKGRPIGVMWMVSLRDTVQLGEQDLALVELLSAFVGSAIGNAQLYDLVAKQNQVIEQLNDSLKQQVDTLAVEASTDKLTGLHNFGYFETELQRRANEGGRRTGKSELSLALIDVDHFKRFNDSFGHIAGNAALQEVARRIRGAARAMDIPCRYGGEEFAVILPKCDIDGAYRFAERVRAEIAGTPFFIDGEYHALTVSAGCATYRTGESLEDFVERADRALYRAKAAGRNRADKAE